MIAFFYFLKSFAVTALIGVSFKHSHAVGRFELVQIKVILKGAAYTGQKAETFQLIFIEEVARPGNDGSMNF